MSIFLEEDLSIMMAAAQVIAGNYGSVENILLAENAPDESRPTRHFFNMAVLAAFELGKRSRQ